MFFFNRYQIEKVGPLTGKFSYHGNPFEGYNESGHRADIVSGQEGRHPDIRDDAVVREAQRNEDEWSNGEAALYFGVY